MYKMFTEQFLIKVLNKVIIKTTTLLERLCRPIALIFIGLLIYTSFSNAIFIAGLRNFVVQMLGLSLYSLLISYVLTQWKTKEGFRQMYEKILAVGVTINTTQETDWVLFMLAVVMTWVVGCTLGFVFILSPSFSGSVVGISTLPLLICLVNKVSLKHLIATRLRYIRSSDEYLDRIEDTISHTRQLLECNSELNKSIQVVGVTYSIYVFTLFQCCIYTIFLIHGAGIVIPTALENNISSTLVIYGSKFIVAFLIAWSSSLVSEEVQEVSLELDATLTARASSDSQKALIRLFLIELHHTPVKLSAMGLFDIDKASLSMGCCITISYLLVLIQFT